MNEPQLTSPGQFTSAQVVLRFALRLAIFCVFASFGAAGFRVMFPTYLVLCAIYCAIAATFRGEAIRGRVFTHWDEAAGYGALASLLTKLSVNP